MYKFSAVNDPNDVLFIQKGPDGKMYTLGPI